jgi:hypothetical protein
VRRALDDKLRCHDSGQLNNNNLTSSSCGHYRINLSRCAHITGTAVYGCNIMYGGSLWPCRVGVLVRAIQCFQQGVRTTFDGSDPDLNILRTVRRHG